MSAILDFAAAVLSAALAGLGVGGGGLLVIYLTFASNVGQLAAQGINLLFYICASAASLSVHLSKRKLSLTVILALAIPGAAGAAGGCIVAGLTEPELLRRLFGGLLALSGMVLLFKKQK